MRPGLQALSRVAHCSSVAPPAGCYSPPLQMRGLRGEQVPGSGPAGVAGVARRPWNEHAGPSHWLTGFPELMLETSILNPESLL